MADFRKLFLALIAGALLLGTVASAAPIQCSVSAVPTIVRQEGVADLAGDILLVCQTTDGSPFPAPTIANVRLRIPGTNITSKIMGTANTPAQNVLESLLILDEAGAGGPVPKGYSSVSPSLSPFADGSQNLYQAVQITPGYDTIEWQGVVLAGPGSLTTSRIMRLTNVRIYPYGFAVGQQIQAIVTIQSSSATISVTPSNTVPSVAEVQRGLYVTYAPLTLNNCAPGSDSPITGNIGVTFREGFATAFKPRWNNQSVWGVSHDTPGGSYLDESGYNPIWSSFPAAPPTTGSLIQGSLIGLTGVGVANNGTRFTVSIINVPIGVTLGIGSISAPNGMTLTGTVDSGNAATGGTWVFTWTVTGYGPPNLSQFQIDAVSVNISVSIAPPVTVTVQPTTAHGRFRPLATTVIASTDGGTEGDDVPRFLDSTTADDRTVLTINQNCKTVLLFPYLVQLGDWDTGIAIANTSIDPFGTVNQSGACTLNFYGVAGGATVNANLSSNIGLQTTPTIPAGGMFVMTLYGGGGVQDISGTFTGCSGTNCQLPGFRGYMIASCNFQYGHGFAFISDLGAQKLAQGYLALVVPYRSSMYASPLGGRPAQNAGLGAAPNEGEQLGN
jgi:hypothetical protein